MSTEAWQRLDRIFVDALQHRPEARTGFVAEACADDPALREEVLSLLTAVDAAGEFMAGTALERLARHVGVHGYTLAPGEQVGGAYTIVRLLGAGGTGEVWQARDARLARDVAIKVLLPHLASDADRLRRFADEARAVGSLNHPNIVAVYDVGEHRGAPYLVSEYLEGETLRSRLGTQTLSVRDVVATALDIARALVAAHARGIVHRDLKPENVFIGRTGGVKLLDFGIAKLQTSGRLDGEMATIAGAILGTAGYMAPEQVRGQEVDARADLFALGVMMYEMLGGTAPFKRASVFETLHAILTSEPPDIGDTHRPVPETLASIVMRLLQKEPGARFQSAADLVWALEGVPTRTAAGGERAPAGPPAWHRRRRIQLAFAVTAAAALASVAWLLPERGARSAAPESAVTRFVWPLPSGVSLASAPAVSPDSRHVAFTGLEGTRSRLYIQSLSAFDATAIDGTEGARLPFWSPDSRWVAFFAGGRLMKVPVAGGAPVAIATRRAPGAGTRRTEMGGTWGGDGVIVYGANFNPPSLFKVPATGGVPAPATRLVTQRGESQHRFPFFLPDGRHFLYLARGRAEERRGVFVGSLDDPEHEGVRVLAVDSNVVYAPVPGTNAGVLLYATNGRLEAQRFDPSRRTITGPAQGLGIEAGSMTMFAPAAIGASSHVLAYATQFGSGLQIKVTGADGRTPTVLRDRHEQQWPRISPDGTRMAYLLIDPHEPNADIWVEDLARRTTTRVTTAPTRDLGHVWSPDGRRLAYRPDIEDSRRLTVVAADGTGASHDVTCPTSFCEPTDWSSDGRELIVNAHAPESTDVWAIAIEAGGTSRPLLHTRFNERDARLSPNRRWIAYVSDEAGSPQVAIRNLDGSPPRRYAVSPAGGDQVVWQRDSQALYYVDPRGRLHKVLVRDNAGHLSLSDPIEMTVTIGSGHSNTQYDIAPDGRIYYLDPTPPPLPTDIRVVLGWQALLK